MPANVTIINIEMQLQGPQGESQDLTTFIDDSTTDTDTVWSSEKTSEEIAAADVTNSIVYAIALG